MKIGELAKVTGTPVETIRFYEREALLLEPPRTQGNYRDYDDAHVHRLAFIRHCRSLDMALDEVRVLLRYKDAPRADCGEVNALLDAHIGHVAQRIHELKSLEKELKRLRLQCDHDQSPEDCGILNTLTQAAQEVPAASRPSRTHIEASHRRSGR